MNDDLADALVIPAVERVQELIQAGFDGAVVWGDGGTDLVRIELDDYWEEGLSESAEHLVARLLREKSITRWVFATPVSFVEPPDGGFMVGHVAVEQHTMVWALCYEEGAGYDLCAMFFEHNSDGSYRFDQDITLLAGEVGLAEYAPGFTTMRDLLEVS